MGGHGHGRARHSRIVSERHEYPLVYNIPQNIFLIGIIMPLNYMMKMMGGYFHLVSSQSLALLSIRPCGLEVQAIL
jgi:hypothetical protein